VTSVMDWRTLPAAQQPEWPDAAQLASVLGELGECPPLVAPHEADALTARLAEVAAGRAFVLQGGDCAEPFGVTEGDVAAKLRIMLQMTMILMYGAGLPVVKIGRIAGQHGKPRSSSTELIDGVELSSYRGPIVNGPEPTLEARTPDPWRMLGAYRNASATLNLIRAMTSGRFASLAEVHEWNMAFVAGGPQGKRYEQLAAEITRALKFFEACGVKVQTEPALQRADFFVSHEALVLDYEQALTRPAGEGWYDLSGHMLWIGERTRQLDGAHVAFLRGVRNPLGVKLGPSTIVREVLELCERLNPDNVPGRLTFIARMGADKVRTVLPPLLVAVRRAGHAVVWICDPMHGNTESQGGFKTRRFDRVMDEVAGFFEACRQTGVYPGGVHLELTGDDVTECLGGSDAVEVAHLGDRYETLYDPRLNASQALDLAFMVAELLR
jgi:3-deoxy-7-phosphoheptulonate synthase